MTQDEAKILYAADEPSTAPLMPYLERMAARCAVILELGSGHGNGSTRAFVRGLEKSPAIGKKLVTVDVDVEKPSIKPEVPYWKHIIGNSVDESTAINTYVKGIGAGGYKPDLIYIDTNHEKYHLEVELPIWHGFAHDRTIWLFHDTWMWGTYNPMTDAILEFCEAHPQWMYVEVTRESHGLGMMIDKDYYEQVKEEIRYAA